MLLKSSNACFKPSKPSSVRFSVTDNIFSGSVRSDWLLSKISSKTLVLSFVLLIFEPVSSVRTCRNLSKCSSKRTSFSGPIFARVFISKALSILFVLFILMMFLISMKFIFLLLINY